MPRYYLLLFNIFLILSSTISIAVGRAFVTHMKTIKSGKHDFLNSETLKSLTQLWRFHFPELGECLRSPCYGEHMPHAEVKTPTVQH